MTNTRDDNRVWDIRTLDRRLRRGQVSRKDLDKHLKSLPDVADKAAPIELANIDDDDDDDVGEGSPE